MPLVVADLLQTFRVIAVCTRECGNRSGGNGKTATSAHALMMPNGRSNLRIAFAVHSHSGRTLPLDLAHMADKRRPHLGSQFVKAGTQRGQVNRRHARRRAPGERGFATLKTWRILNKIRCTVDKVGAIAQAILVLHLATSTTIRLK